APVGSGLVYFKAAEDARVVLSFVGQNKVLPANVQLKFSKAVLQRFGALADKRPPVMLDVDIDGAGRISLKAAVCEIDASDACTVGLEGSKSDIEQINSAKGPKLALSFVAEDAPPTNPEFLPFGK